MNISMFEEFKKFIQRGNVMDMAVGVIIGAAFGKIVNSFVNDILMPPLGLIMGQTDMSNLFINLSKTPVDTLAQAKELGVPVIAYGSFINVCFDFLIVAYALFVIVMMYNRVNAPKEEAPKRTCPFCKQEIADDATRCPHCTSELEAA